MPIIRQDDFIQSIADALQYISYYHPKDFIDAVYGAYQREESPAAKDALAQILINSRMSAEGRRPICQDTGIVTVFLKIGMDARWEASMSVEEMVNEGVRRGYQHPDNILRASVLADPAGSRRNTRDNTPAVIHMSVVPGNQVEVELAAKGGGSEAKSQFAMLNPSDSLVDWVIDAIPRMGAGWCPPGILGIGVGGTAEKAMLLAKEACMESIDIHELQARGPSNRIEEMRLEIFEKANKLGIGAQGLGDRIGTDAGLRPVRAVDKSNVLGFVSHVPGTVPPQDIPFGICDDHQLVQRTGLTQRVPDRFDDLCQSAALPSVSDLGVGVHASWISQFPAQTPQFTTPPSIRISSASCSVCTCEVSWCNWHVTLPSVLFL